MAPFHFLLEGLGEARPITPQATRLSLNALSGITLI